MHRTKGILLNLLLITALCLGLMPAIPAFAAMDVLYDGTVILAIGETFEVTAYNTGGGTYNVSRTTPLGALDVAATAANFTYDVTDKRWSYDEVLLLDNVDGYLYQKTPKHAWYAYVNDVYKDGYGNHANGLNVIQLVDGDTVEFYYVEGAVNATDLDAVKAAAGAAVKTVVYTMDVLFEGTVNLTSGETFEVTAYNSPYPLQCRAGLHHLVRSMRPRPPLISPTMSPINDGVMTRFSCWTTLTAISTRRLPGKPGTPTSMMFTKTDMAITIMVSTSFNLSTVIWSSSTMSTAPLPTRPTLLLLSRQPTQPSRPSLLRVVPQPIGLLSLQVQPRCQSLNQILRRVLPAVTMYPGPMAMAMSGEAYPYGCSLPWLMMTRTSVSDHYSFNDDLAAQHYEVNVIAGDNWTATLDSADIARDDGYIVANTLNGEELPLETESGKPCWPLYLKGSEVFGGQQVGNIVRIELSGLPEPPEGWTLELVGDVGDIITQV